MTDQASMPVTEEEMRHVITHVRVPGTTSVLAKDVISKEFLGDITQAILALLRSRIQPSGCAEAIAAEREACVKLVMERAAKWNAHARVVRPQLNCCESLADECEDIAVAIRARTPPATGEGTVSWPLVRSGEEV